MGKSSAEIDRGPPQGAAEVSAKLPPAALESTLHVSCIMINYLFVFSFFLDPNSKQLIPIQPDPDSQHWF